MFRRLFWLLCGKWIVPEQYKKRETVSVDIQAKDGWWLALGVSMELEGGKQTQDMNWRQTQQSL